MTPRRYTKWRGGVAVLAPLDLRLIFSAVDYAQLETVGLDLLSCMPVALEEQGWVWLDWPTKPRSLVRSSGFGITQVQSTAIAEIECNLSTLSNLNYSVLRKTFYTWFTGSRGTARRGRMPRSLGVQS